MNKKEFYKCQEVGMGMIEGIGKSNFFIINSSYIAGVSVTQAINNPKFIAFDEDMNVVSPEFDDLEGLIDYLKNKFSTPVNLLRKSTGMNIKEFANFFNVPYRTIQNWDSGIRECPEYLIELMKYKLEKENII